MATNILKAILNIIANPPLVEGDEEDSKEDVANRVQAQGRKLELYVENAFANSFGLTGNTKKKKRSDTFSYVGAKSKLPDLMIRNGDIIEVKKIESLNSDLQLNSSHPKNKVYVTDTRVHKDCKKAEEWQVKDMLYCIGTVPATKPLRAMWMVYGDCFVANKDVYEGISSNVSEAIASTGLDSEETTEIARFNEVDPLRVTSLRVRGMWIIKHPNVVFAEDAEITGATGFDIRALMRATKYESLPLEDRHKIENSIKADGNLSKKELEIENPDNPAELIKAILISYRIES